MRSKVFLLWDVQNVNFRSQKDLNIFLEVVIQKAQHSGRIVQRKAYGSITTNSDRLEKTRMLLINHGFRYISVGNCDKNAVDHHLTFDGVRIAATGQCDHFFLIAGDGDYIPLIKILKDRGNKVTVFAKKKSASSKLIAIADEVHFLEQLIHLKFAA